MHSLYVLYELRNMYVMCPVHVFVWLVQVSGGVQTGSDPMNVTGLLKDLKTGALYVFLVPNAYQLVVSQY